MRLHDTPFSYVISLYTRNHDIHDRYPLCTFMSNGKLQYNNLIIVCYATLSDENGQSAARIILRTKLHTLHSRIQPWFKARAQSERHR